MTVTTLNRDFPRSEVKLRGLVDEHRRIKDEPVLLALYYAPQRDPQDIFLFEVLDQFGANSIDPDRQLFEVTYGSTRAFPVDAGQELHLVLTNPAEAKVAFEEGWTGAAEIRDAIDRGDYRVVYLDPAAPHIWELVRGQ